jgi:glycosyltransferase involved in cell wall biosynthesis
VLLIAEACNPEWVSIPLEGWSLYAALRKVADVHLVTQQRNREAIKRAGLVEGRDFTAINSEALVGPVNRAAVFLRGGKSVGWTTQMALMGLCYPYFEHLIWEHFGDDLANGAFDLVHRLTPVSPTVPSPIAAKCRRVGVPFVLGPLNGGIPWPKGFNKERLKEHELLSYVRDVYKLMPGYRQTLLSASTIMAGSRYTLSQVPPWAAKKACYVAENGIDPTRFDVVRTKRATKPLKVVYVGRLVPYKGADILLEAAEPLMRRGDVEVSILGDGPLMSELKQYARSHSLEGKVHLLGNVPHTKLRGILAEQDLFAFPSIREFGGAVVIEAMAVGVVPAVVNYGGPGELVTPETGVLVPLGHRPALIQAFREVFEGFVREPHRIDEMSPRARARALTEFTWDHKADQILAIYRSTLTARKATQPDPTETEMPETLPAMTQIA